MTTQIIDAPDISTEEVTYEPNVADKIQRVLYRLDHGEQLISGLLKYEDNFCVLGLFADESGLGKWVPKYNLHIETYSSNDGLIRSSAILCVFVADYYNLRTCTGRFNVNSLPEHLQVKLEEHEIEADRDGLLDLDYVNDVLVADNVDAGEYNIETNEILAAIIRSGVIFKDPDEPKGD